MAMSPLTASLLQDPAYLPAQQRLGLAQGMLGAGLDSSPAYPAQALSRLGQALVGAYMLKHGMQDISDVTAQRQQQANDLIRGMQVDLSGSQPQAPAAPAAPAGTAPTPVPLAAATHQMESSGSMAPGITGDGGAGAGPMQVHQDALTDVNRHWGTNYTLEQLTADPQLGKRVGDMYLALQQQRFPGHPELALAAYNAGPTATANAGGPGVPGVPPQAAGYVAKGLQLAGAQPPQDGAMPATPGGMPPTGLQSPMVHTAMDMMRRAQSALMAVPPTHPFYEQIKNAALMQMQQAQAIMGLDSFHTLPNGTQVNTRTGQIGNAAAPNAQFVPTPYGAVDITGTHAPVFAPAPRPFTGPHGEMGAVGPGGQITSLADNPSGFHGGTPEAQAAQALVELAPTVKNGTATPDQVNRFRTAVTLFQNFHGATNPATGALGIAPERPLPEGIPQAAGGGGSTGFVPVTPGSRGPQAAQAITQGAGEADIKAASEEQDAAQKGHNVLGTTATIRSTLPQVTTGVGAEQRLRAAQIFQSLGVDPKTAQSWVGTSAAPGEVLQKKLFELTTGAVREMGAREPGSVMLMFQKNYPQMTSQNMTIDAMTRLIDMDQLYKEDAAAGKRSYLNAQVEGLKGGKQYEGPAGYQPPDPRIYQAAALATGGMPFSVWSQGLTPDQQAEALRLGGRLYPDASALDAKNVRHFFRGGGQNG